MLIHAHDRSEDDRRWREFVGAQGFGHFVAAGRGRELPVVVPTQFSLVGDEVWLHLAAANPVFAALGENPRALLSVAGDWAFVPGAWKAVGGEDPRLGIPTTYYAAVQLSGPVRIDDAPAAVAEVLRRQRAELEPDGDHVDPLAHGAHLRIIRALRLQVQDVRAKFKYGGNVDDAHRRAVAENLVRRQGPGDASALRHIALGDASPR